MRRRHLFDHGDPVCAATLRAGSEVLLALSRQSVHHSRVRLARVFSRLADSSARIMQSAACEGYRLYPRARMHCSNQFQSGALRPRLPRS